MERRDDYEVRRNNVAVLSDSELQERFWELAARVVEPMVELARSNTSPSIERSVLLRMGFSSLEAKAIVDQCMRHSVLGKGAGGVVVRLARAAGIPVSQAGRDLGAGRMWEQALACLRQATPGPAPGGVAGGAPRSALSGGPGVAPPGGARRVLDPGEKLDVEDILKDLECYHPRRRGWHWREGRGPARVGQFDYKEVSEPLKRSVPLPAAEAFGGIDPQPDCVLTSEIASGRFEDDIRRMRMAAWHGADHIMVIRTAGQSHFDGLIEGTPEGVGGVPITRKQLRASRKALDMIEDEVGRPINLHSYVSGVAGPEIAVLFVEEGVNGAHQDPQYNVLYRNINMYRSFVDAAVAKTLMTAGDMAQIDGAHNANATAREAWKVMPELLVQHAINCAYSVAVGMPKDSICLSTVPPTVSPTPCVRLDLPYAVAVRDLFRGFRFRAQMNTKYIQTDTREATVTHTLNVLLSRLTEADIQSTITPDEGRNIPWHYNSIAAVNTAKQALIGLDGISEMVTVERRPGGELARRVRELEERAVLFLEEILGSGGYFAAVSKGFFVDSGYYPERNGDGIVRNPEGGVASGSVVPRDPDYAAPVCAHFGYNNIEVLSPGPEQEPGAGAGNKPCRFVGGCTLCDASKIVFVDELDEADNVGRRLDATGDLRRSTDAVLPEAEWFGDGVVVLTMFFPTSKERAEFAGMEAARRMGLADPKVVNSQVMHPSEGTLVEVRARMVEPVSLGGYRPARDEGATGKLPPDEIRREVAELGLRVVAATVGNDEHSVGMREIIDIKHGGLEGFGVTCYNLGTSVPVEKLVDAAIEVGARAILASLIITHADIHKVNMRRLAQVCEEKGVRQRLLLVAGGTQINNDIAVAAGLDAGFGRGTRGIDVAGYLVRKLRESGQGR